ncbi:MAG: TSUP family transporter [Acidiferrobacterales bacterium]|nr:TSUP family transporter [Acidiferrobacterales bacterium]
MELAIEALLWLGLIGIIAGFVDSAAGGGGLIAVPAMLLFGVPPINALATNKLQGSFGTATAAITMLKRGKVTLSRPLRYFALALIGGALGTWMVQQFPAEALKIIVPLVLTVIALYFLLAGSNTEKTRSARMGNNTYLYAVVPPIGFYDGFFGPGAGSFYAATGVALRGNDMVGATANAKLLNFASNIASLVVFVIGGKVLWIVGGVMILGQMLGAYLGSLAVISYGGRLVRPLIVLACLLMVTRYAWQEGYLVW